MILRNFKTSINILIVIFLSVWFGIESEQRFNFGTTQIYAFVQGLHCFVGVRMGLMTSLFLRISRLWDFLILLLFMRLDLGGNLIQFVLLFNKGMILGMFAILLGFYFWDWPLPWLSVVHGLHNAGDGLFELLDSLLYFDWIFLKFLFQRQFDSIYVTFNTLIDSLLYLSVNVGLLSKFILVSYCYSSSKLLIRIRFYTSSW